MASSLFCPLSARSLPVIDDSTSRSSFLHRTKLSSCGPPFIACARRSVARRGYRSPSAMSFDHIPKQFREENLKDGLKDNYKNVPQYLYGLTPSQMDMFMTEDSPVRRLSEQVTEESISSAKAYAEHGGMFSLSATGEKGRARFSMSVSMYRGGGRGYGRPRSAPPDLPSLLLDARIVYLGLPIVPEVSEVLAAQFMWLDFDDSTKPIHLYINSSGTQNEKREIVGSETDAFAIADMILLSKSKVYTLNLGMAMGQAAMLLSLGEIGHRFVLPHASTKLYLPKVGKSSGATTDMWIKAKELESNTDYFLELLEVGTGKPKEELRKDLQESKYFLGADAIDYGLADKIMVSLDTACDRKDYDAMMLQSKAERRQAGGRLRDPVSGFS